MKYNKFSSVFCSAALGLLLLTGCEGADLYEVDAPDWISAKIDSINANATDTDILYVPNPDKLGAADNSSAFWTEFTDDVKVDSGQTYKINFTNYGGNSNWKNFIIVLRNQAKDVEYAVLRADNWGWGTGYAGEESDTHFAKATESGRDWATWLSAMSKAKCTATITNNGNGSADVKIVMNGSDGKVYKQEYIGVTGVDKDDCYFCFTVDGCHLVFGDKEEADQQPVSMVLNNVPKKVLLGTKFEDLIANVNATVTYEKGNVMTIEAANLQLQAVPDMNQLGTKALVAVYNKTLNGEAAGAAVVATAEFEVVEKFSDFKCVGNPDNTSPFAGDFSEDIKVAPGETYVTTFTNYTNGAENWYNFLVELFNADKTKYYATVRADNFGWGDGYAACTPVGTQGDWVAWLAAMDGAKVTVYVTNNGDGTADIKCVMLGNNGITYTQDYTGINTVDPNDMYFHLTIEKAHLEFDTVVGAEDNSSSFAADHSAAFHVPSGATLVTRFTNYTNGLNNWYNFLVELFNADKSKYYATVRADNFGWGDGYAACTPVGTQGDWVAWLAAMDGAKVTVYVTNNGDGTADIKCVMLGNNGIIYTQDYTGINTVDPADLYFHLTIEGAHLVFE